MRILVKNKFRANIIIISIGLLFGVLVFAPARFGAAVYADDQQIPQTQEEEAVPAEVPVSDEPNPVEKTTPLTEAPTEKPSTVVAKQDLETAPDNKDADEKNAPDVTSRGGETEPDESDQTAETISDEADPVGKTSPAAAEEADSDEVLAEPAALNRKGPALRGSAADGIIKFTDNQGNLLKLANGSDAVFTTFEEAVAALNINNVYDSTGTPYTGHVMFELLVDLVETPNTINPATFDKTRDITFRTASTAAADGYPYRGTSNKAQITFMNGQAGNSTHTRFVFTGNGSKIRFENIIIDGRADKGITANDGAIINVGSRTGTEIGIILTLGNGAVIQNGACNRNDQGGGLYIGKGCKLYMEPGSVIQDCKAVIGRDACGGAVYLNNAEFYCDGGIIRNCVSFSGAAVDLGGEQVGVQSDKSRIYLMGNPQIIDNYDLDGNRRNVHLNYNSNMIINVDKTLSDEAQIGIYADDQGNVYNDHGHEGQPFALIKDGINPGKLGSFTNDRDTRLTGEKGTRNGSLVVWFYEMNAQAYEDFMRNGEIVSSSLIDGSTGKFRPGTLPTTYSEEEIAGAYKDAKGFVVSGKSEFDHLVLEKYGNNSEVPSGITNIRYTPYLEGRRWEYSTDGGSTWNPVNGREFTFHYSRDIMNTITYDPNGGNWNGSADPVSFDEEYGTNVDIYNAPVRDGYDFICWKENDSEYQPGDELSVTDDHTFTAQWKEKENPVNPPVNPPVDPPVDPVTPPVNPPIIPDNPVTPDNPGGGGGAAGGGGGAPAALAVAATAPDNTVVADNDVPLDDGEDIIEEPVPQAAPEGYWALVNLICTILTVIGAIVLATRRKKDDDEDEEDEDDDSAGKRRMCKIGAAVSAVASVVALLLTEDFTLPMRMVDRYTILMVVILAVCAATMLLHRRFNRGQEEESEE